MAQDDLERLRSKLTQLRAGEASRTDAAEIARRQAATKRRESLEANNRTNAQRVDRALAEVEQLDARLKKFGGAKADEQGERFQQEKRGLQAERDKRFAEAEAHAARAERDEVASRQRIGYCKMIEAGMTDAEIERAMKPEPQPEPPKTVRIQLDDNGEAVQR
jgi:hypothetical protein